jgi:hypothetical protein
MTLYYNTINPIQPLETTHLEAATPSTYQEAVEKRRKEQEEKCWCYHKHETCTDRIMITCGGFLAIVILIVLVISVCILLDIVLVSYNSAIDYILTYLFGADAYSKYYAICDPRVTRNTNY